MKKTRPDPFSEGSIASIYRWFFGPLIRYKALHIDNVNAYRGSHNAEVQEPTIAEWMEYLFHTRYRDVSCYVARTPFILPGLYVVNSVNKIQGIGYRKIKAGQELWVRTDERTPEAIDVEVLAGQGKSDQVFELSASQWGEIRPMLILRETDENRD